MVTGDLLELDRAVACRALEPRREALVELGTLLLGKAVIRRVSYELMPEAEGVLSEELGLFRPDQLLAHERDEMRRHLRLQLERSELADGAPVEDLALNGCTLDDLTLSRVQSFEPGGQQRLNR